MHIVLNKSLTNSFTCLIWIRLPWQQCWTVEVAFNAKEKRRQKQRTFWCVYSLTKRKEAFIRHRFKSTFNIFDPSRMLVWQLRGFTWTSGWNPPVYLQQKHQGSTQFSMIKTSSSRCRRTPLTARLNPKDTWTGSHALSRLTRDGGIILHWTRRKTAQTALKSSSHSAVGNVWALEVVQPCFGLCLLTERR